MTRPGISRSVRWCVVMASMWICCGCMPAAEQSAPNTKLPGFDVWMPKGVVVKKHMHPAVGSYQVRSGTSLPALPQPLRSLFPERAPSTKVTWRVETAAFSEETDVKNLLDAALQGLAIGKGKVTSAGQGRWISTYEFKKGKLVAGYVRCEPWLTIMFLIGLEGDVYDENSALRIVRSVRCRIGDREAPSLDVSVNVPERFGLALNTDQPTYFSTTGAGLLTSFTEGNIARDYKLVRQVFGSMFAAALGSEDRFDVSVSTLVRPDGAPATLSTLSGNAEIIGEGMHVGTVYCPELDMTAMVVIFGNADPEVDPVVLAESLQCPGSEAAETKHATIDEVFSPICESGDLSACQHLIELIRSENAAGAVMSLERAKQQACALGDRNHCS